ncbi:MAG: lipoyl synthase [Bacteroidales bacterium]
MLMEKKDPGKRRLPLWLKMKMPKGESYSRVKNLVQKYGLHTICTSGNCPNIGECWGAGTATFMILGDICTRKCKFCGVKTGKPAPPDTDEPLRVAESVRIMKLRHCVLTSVDRDDLPDGGAGLWAGTIRKIREINPHTTIEALIPDFDGLPENLDLILAAAPEVISHNMETVRRLTPFIRSRARYEKSLQVLKYLAENKAVTKSGIMLGLGERREEVLETMDDLLSVGCRILTIGQYLAPTLLHMPVAEYFPPEVFREYEQIGLEKGFRFVESSPLVRSSYHAEKHVENKK